MQTVPDSIGNRFEQIFIKRFPDLTDLTEDTKSVPDFLHPSGFYIEAKVGNIEWGVRIKRYQIERFRRLNLPSIYAIGLHNFNNAFARLSGKTEAERQRILAKNMDIVQVYFMNGEVIDKLWRRERRMNEKGTMEYCMIKKGVLMHTLLNRMMKREGKTMPAHEYYGLESDRYLIQSNNDHMEDGCSFRIMLDCESDKKAIAYFKKQGIIAT